MKNSKGKVDSVNIIYFLIVFLMIVATFGVNLIDSRTQVYTARYPSGPVCYFLAQIVHVAGFNFLDTERGLTAGFDIETQIPAENKLITKDNIVLPTSTPKRKRSGGGGGGWISGDVTQDLSDGLTLIVSSSVDCNLGIVTVSFVSDNSPIAYSVFSSEFELLYSDELSTSDSVEFLHADVAGTNFVASDQLGLSSAVVPELSVCDGIQEPEGNQMDLTMKVSSDCFLLIFTIVSSYAGTLKQFDTDGNLLNEFIFSPGTFRKSFLKGEVEGTSFEANNEGNQEVRGYVPPNSFSECEQECRQRDCEDASCPDGRTFRGCADNTRCYDSSDCDIGNLCSTDADCTAVVCSGGQILNECIAGLCATLGDCQTADRCVRDSDCFQTQCNDGTREGGCNVATGMCRTPSDRCVGSGGDDVCGWNAWKNRGFAKRTCRKRTSKRQERTF